MTTNPAKDPGTSVANHRYPSLWSPSEIKINHCENTTDNTSESSAKEIERGNWGRSIEFILSCIGSAIGLGTIWRFPFLVFRNGGGAFLVPFIIMVILVGIPVFFFELCLGQFGSLGAITVWRLSPILKGVGIGLVITDAFIMLYFNVVIAYIVYYFIASMGPLPWLGSIRHLLKTPSEEFFFNKALHMSAGIGELGGVLWQLTLTLLIAWVIVFVVISKGVQSLGKAAYFTSTFPFVIVTIMLVRAATLPGAATGIIFYLKPDLSRLADGQVWNDAASQVFFILSSCEGIIITYGSYNKFNHNCLRDAIMISTVTCVNCIYSGFLVFSVLGFMAESKGVDIQHVVREGPGLVFIVYAEALSQMPVPVLWALMFFLTMLLLGFSSQFGITEVVMSALLDEYSSFLRASKLRIVSFRFLACMIFFLLSLPMVTRGGFYLFHLIDSFITGYSLLMSGFFEVAGVMYVYGYDRFFDDCAMMLGKRPHIYFKLTWIVITPVTLLALIIAKFVTTKPLKMDKYEYPQWALNLGWLMVTFSVIWIPIFAVWSTCKHGGYAAMKRAREPSPEWGPAVKSDRTGRYAPALSKNTNLP